jgi:tetratricopeptide (TPR) repeat protein
MNIKTFLKECNTRDVFKLLSIYVVSSWVILQVLSVIAQPLNLPIQSIPILILLVIIGFPFYIIYIWNTRLSKSWKSEEDDTSVELIDKSKFRQIYFTILGVIIFFSALSIVIIINNSFSSAISLPKLVSNDKIAVLKFTNNTGDEKMNIIGNMTEDWIGHGITENNAGQIITQDIVKSYADVIKTQKLDLSANEILNKYLKPGKKIMGSYFLDGNKLIFKSSIKNGLTEETLISLESIDCDSKNPLDCIEILEGKIVTYLLTSKNGSLSFENQPPKYEAYKALLEARISKREDDLDKYIVLLNNAIALDSNFFEPQSLKVGYYYNKGLYSTADSIIDNIKKHTGISLQQRNSLNMYKAALDGDNRILYKYHTNEYLNAPYHLDTNTSQMVSVLQFVNKPEDVEAIFNETHFDNFNLENCKPCVDRMYLMALAFHELKQDTKTIDLLEPYVNVIEDRDFLKAIITAYVFSNNKEKVDNLLQKLNLKIKKEDLLSINLFTAQQFLMIGNNEASKPYLNTIVNTETNKDTDYFKAEAYYELGDYDKSEHICLTLLKENPNNPKIIAILSKCYFKNGKPIEGKNLIGTLEKLRGPYQFGEIDYRLAEIYASQNDEENVFKYLLQSIASGNFYTNVSFKNDIDFIPFLNSEKWHKIMTYWH